MVRNKKNDNDMAARYSILVKFLNEKCNGNITEMSRRIGVTRQLGQAYLKERCRVPANIRNRLEMDEHQQKHDAIQVALYNKFHSE